MARVMMQVKKEFPNIEYSILLCNMNTYSECSRTSVARSNEFFVVNEDDKNSNVPQSQGASSSPLRTMEIILGLVSRTTDLAFHRLYIYLIHHANEIFLTLSSRRQVQEGFVRVPRCNFEVALSYLQKMRCQTLLVCALHFCAASFQANQNGCAVRSNAVFGLLLLILRDRYPSYAG